MGYQIFHRPITLENGERCESYGVTCGKARVEDVTTDGEALDCLVGLMNELKLEPEHLLSELEDFVAML